MTKLVLDYVEFLCRGIIVYHGVDPDPRSRDE